MHHNIATGAQCSYSKGHGNAVVVVALHLAATQLAALNTNTVCGGLGVNTQSDQAVGHTLDTVALFHSQFFSAGKHCSALGAGGGDKQYGEFINGQWHLVLGDSDAFEGAVTHANIGNRLTPYFDFIAELNTGTHGAQNIDYPNSSEVNPYMAQNDI